MMVDWLKSVRNTAGYSVGWTHSITELSKKVRQIYGANGYSTHFSKRKSIRVGETIEERGCHIIRFTQRMGFHDLRPNLGSHPDNLTTEQSTLFLQEVRT
jgi:hypothetical protein